MNKNFYNDESDHFNIKFQEYDNKNIDLKKRIFGFDLKNYLTNTLLRDSDVASMSNSIELRPVFLDHKLVELAASTTQYAKIEYDNSKIALRNIIYMVKCFNQPFSLAGWISTISTKASFNGAVVGFKVGKYVFER